MPRTFPQGFRWGVATSGHQTEGGNTGSDTWFLEHVRPTAFREPSGLACHGYQLWREDVGLVAGLGLDAYRFSVEWARVEPAEGEFSAGALAHYRAIADRCVAAASEQAGVPRYAHEATGVPVFVTEHGLGHADDRLRAALLEPALAGLLDAVEDGVPVLGYLHWSLLDNFEWVFGFDVRFGLHAVDRATFARWPKPSAAVYAAIARANGGSL
jgi:beta-glucosidase/6-phospho-beta-glucosidase/beta-galactosidase